MLRLLKVKGDSLFPTYKEGDFVLVAKIPFFTSTPRPGDIIVFHHEIYGTMVKKVDSVNEERDEFFVLGTHADSLDSRLLGGVAKRDLIGKVIWHIQKPAR
jgi:signal peptidase I